MAKSPGRNKGGASHDGRGAGRKPADSKPQRHGAPPARAGQRPRGAGPAKEKGAARRREPAGEPRPVKADEAQRSIPAAPRAREAQHPPAGTEGRPVRSAGRQAENESENEKMVFKVERAVGSNLLSIETGKIARQAAGAAVVRYGDTVVLGTVVTADPRPGIDFFPLTVDYREKMSAAGKFPGGFFKREGRPTTKEVLSARLIDRPMRPLFPEGFKNEVQIQLMVLASDLQNDPDVLGMVAAAGAMAVSPVPFHGPIAGVRVGRVEGKLIINPTQAQLEYSDLDLVVAGHMEAVTMIELGCRELSESDVAEAIEFGHEQGVRPVCEMLK